MAILRSSSGGAGSGMQIGNPFSFGAAGFVKQAYVDATDIDKLNVNIKSFRDPLKLVLNNIIQPAIVKNFASQGRPEWRPLSEATKTRRGPHKPRAGTKKRRSSLNMRILDDTGFLKKIATQKNIWEIKDDQITFMVNFFTQRVPYGGFQQLGTRNMVARPFISITDGEAEEIELVFEEWLEKRIRKYWGTGGGIGE